MKEYKKACEVCKGRGCVPSCVPSPDDPWMDACDCRNTSDPSDPSDPSEKKYMVVCYMRIAAYSAEELTLKQATSEAEQATLMQPENIYRVEKIGDDNVVS